MSKMDYIAGEAVEETGDFILEEKDNNLFLTEQGNHKIEKIFSLDNLSDPENISIQHGMDMARVPTT